jgi:hypothetical protein
MESARDPDNRDDDEADQQRVLGEVLTLFIHYEVAEHRSHVAILERIADPEKSPK